VALDLDTFKEPHLQHEIKSGNPLVCRMTDSAPRVVQCQPCWATSVALFLMRPKEQ
jgi:hypothetical protein